MQLFDEHHEVKSGDRAESERTVFVVRLAKIGQQFAAAANERESNMKNRKLIGSVAAVLATVMLMPGIAGANQPVTSTITFDNQGIVIENYCSDGIDVEFGAAGQLQSKDFFNRDGVLIRTQTQATLEVTLSLSSTKEVLDGKLRYRVNIDRLTGQRDFNGLLFKINVPGEGGVYRDVGTQVFDDGNEKIFIAGQDAPLNSLDFVCEYLGHLG